MTQLVQNMDVVPFIILFSTCSAIFKNRNAYFQYIKDLQQFKTLYNRSYINVLFNSYVHFEHFRGAKKATFNRLPDDLDYVKSANTLTLLQYQCSTHANLHEVYDKDTQLLDICCRTVCQKNNYKYNGKPHASLFRLFWLNWQDVYETPMLVCEMVYHVANRKHKNIHNMIKNQPFKTFDSHSLPIIIKYLIEYLSIEMNHKFQVCVGGLLFALIRDRLSDFQMEQDLLKSCIKEGVIHFNTLKEQNPFPDYLFLQLLELYFDQVVLL